jgi:hypothetical protein
MENSDDELTSQACLQKIYKKQIKTLDSQLNELYPILKPQAKEIYYDRKIELSNVYAAKKKSDKNKLEALLEKTRAKSVVPISTQLKAIAEKYDIKHPIRGEEFQGSKKMKQEFKDKIQYKMESNKSFMGYKRDQRGVLEVSPITGEKYVEEQKTKYDNLKTKLKYRLYGADGVSDYEIRKLVKMGEIEKK